MSTPSSSSSGRPSGSAFTGVNVLAPSGAAAPGRPPGQSDEEPQLVVVRVWQLPTRLIHWGLVASILVLALSGLYIGNPALLPMGQHLTMSDIKAVHYATGLIFIALLIARFIWMFSGNRYERLNQFLPLQRERRALIVPSIKYYSFLRREPPPVVGHNPLAGLTYFILLLMLVVEAATGLALKGLESGRGSLLWSGTHWIFSLAHIPTIRFVHHLILWLIVGFLIHHVYSAVLVDREERSGLVSSIVTGNKTVPKDRL